jgi:hypothetical protein
MPTPPSPTRSRRRASIDPHERPPSPPTQTFHPSLLPNALPTDGLFSSAVGGAHYSGAHVIHRDTDIKRASFGDRSGSMELSEGRKRLLDDLHEVS